MLKTRAIFDDIAVARAPAVIVMQRLRQRALRPAPG
jgi:hypothetical protein